MVSTNSDENAKMIRAMSAPPVVSPSSTQTAFTDEAFIGPKLLGQTRDETPLAFLPNLMPTFKTESGNADDDGLHMFSLVHQQPTGIDQGWRVMLRDNLKQIVVDATSLSIIERLGAVDWVPLPGGMTEGSAGIYCYTPDVTAAKMLRDVAPIAGADEALKDAIIALENVSLDPVDEGHEESDESDADHAPAAN